MPIWLDTPTRPSPFHVGTWRSCTRSCTSCGLPSIAIGLTSGSPCHPHNRATTCTTFFFLPVSTTPHLSFSPSRPAPPPPPSPDDPSLRCRCAAAANSGKYVRSPLFFPSPTASPYGGGSEPIGLDWNLVFGLDLDLVSMVWDQINQLVWAATTTYYCFKSKSRCCRPELVGSLELWRHVWSRFMTCPRIWLCPRFEPLDSIQKLKTVWTGLDDEHV